MNAESPSEQSAIAQQLRHLLKGEQFVALEVAAGGESPFALHRLGYYDDDREDSGVHGNSDGFTPSNFIVLADCRCKETCELMAAALNSFMPKTNGKKNVISSSEREPKPDDADAIGQVSAWDAEKKCWVKRFWFEIASHPMWSAVQKKEILERYPLWKKSA